MKINNEKLVGYILLIVGLCIMVYAIVTAIGVFTGGSGIPIKILEETTQGTSGGTTAPNPSDMMTPLFPMFNAMIWLTIAFFLVSAGGHIARVGIQMMKASLPDIKIIKEKEIREITDEVMKKREKEDLGKTK